MDISEIKEYCINEFKRVERRKPILDIFYVILKDQGKSYMSTRAAWIKTNSAQLDLFKEVKK